MKALLLLIALSQLPLTFGQKDNGYFGHKALIQVEGLVNRPLFYNVFSRESSNSAYKRIGNKLSESNDKFNYGYRLTAGYAAKRNLSILVEIGQEFSSVYPKPNNLFYNELYSPLIDKHEMIDVVSTTFIPKLEFASAKSLLPMGLGHQFGIGIENTAVKRKDYLHVVNHSSSDSLKTYSTSYSDLDPIDFSKVQPVRKIVVLYALSMRTPITKQMMIQYGIRYTLHLGNIYSIFNPNKDSNENQMGNTNYTKELMFVISKQRALSLISANIGLTYTF